MGAANFVGADGATIGTAIKKAKGRLSEVANIEDSFANLANKIIKLAWTNALYKNIIDTPLLEDGTDSNVADIYFGGFEADARYSNIMDYKFKPTGV